MLRYRLQIGFNDLPKGADGKPTAMQIDFKNHGQQDKYARYLGQKENYSYN